MSPAYSAVLAWGTIVESAPAGLIKISLCVPQLALTSPEDVKSHPHYSGRVVWSLRREKADALQAELTAGEGVDTTDENGNTICVREDSNDDLLFVADRFYVVVPRSLVFAFMCTLRIALAEEQPR